MLKIKRLYLFIIQTFLPVFSMTFGICLFIVLMQFLWRYVEDLVGKGLDNLILAELFFYAGLNLIPLALPLSLLLASLMAFGNMGEQLELLAIKASGVSLLKMMKPLIILVGAICIGAFFFQNEAMPRIQVKLRSLMISIKQKSPELDIPEGSFYSGIDNYSIYVKKKDPETKVLKDVMIYDTSDGFDNMSVFVCDSARMGVAESKDFLKLNLYYGQRFANFRQMGLNSDRSYDNKFIPYSRENFKEKEVIIPFDASFNRMDESNLDGTQISKNIIQLTQSIDSMQTNLDSVNKVDRVRILENTYSHYRYQKSPDEELYNKQMDSTKQKANFPTKINFDSLLNTFSYEEMSTYVSNAASDAESNRFSLLELSQKETLQRNVRYHKIEWHQKFTLSFACLIFFFIGAPLGAIIRKGGLGMPVVVSVILFIVYYIINNIGYKMARDGVWEVWQGMWLSSFALFPLGAFLTYKAMNDSALFNPEAYSRFYRKIFRIKTPEKISIEERAAIIEKIPSMSSLHIDDESIRNLLAMDTDKLRDINKNYIDYGYGKEMQTATLSILKERGDDLHDIIDSHNYKYASKDFESFSISSIATIITYVILLAVWILDIANFGIFSIVLYLIFFSRSLTYYTMFQASSNKKSKTYQFLVKTFAFIAYPITFWYIRAQMKQELKNIKANSL